MVFTCWSATDLFRSNIPDLEFQYGKQIIPDPLKNTPMNSYVVKNSGFRYFGKKTEQVVVNITYLLFNCLLS